MSKIPFVLITSDLFGRGDASSGYVTVNLDGSSHDLPLTVVYDSSSQSSRELAARLANSTFHFGYEEILPIGKEISVVGKICIAQNGRPKISTCEDLPYFLSNKTEAGMVVDLRVQTFLFAWGVVVLGTLSVGFLSYFLQRKWPVWKLFKKHQRRARQWRNVPREELYDNCLSTKKDFMLVPCGHLACCLLGAPLHVDIRNSQSVF